MHHGFPSRFVACSWIAAALMLWGGWMAMPVHIGTHFEPGDFARVDAGLNLWIWTYRVHLFGMVVTGIALISLAALLSDSPARVVVWPGAAVAMAGMIVGAAGAAFYYHHGVWGAFELRGKPPEDARAFVDALRADTEYVRCLVRFGRVFSGLGLVLLGAAWIKWKILPVALGLAAAALGLAAMAQTMLLPDEHSLWMAVFHAQSLWLLVTGVVMWRRPIAVAPAGAGTSRS